MTDIRTQALVQQPQAQIQIHPVYAVVWSPVKRLVERPPQDLSDIMVGLYCLNLPTNFPCLMGPSLEGLLGQDAMAAMNEVLPKPVSGSVVQAIRWLGVIEGAGQVYSVRISTAAMAGLRARKEPLYGMQFYTLGFVDKMVRERALRPSTRLADSAFLMWSSQVWTDLANAQ